MAKRSVIYQAFFSKNQLPLNNTEKLEISFAILQTAGKDFSNMIPGDVFCVESVLMIIKLPVAFAVIPS